MNNNDQMITDFCSKGKELKNAGDFCNAITFFDKVIELDSNNAEAYFEKGYCLGNVKKHEEAIACYDKAIELNPMDDSAWYNIAFCLRELWRQGEGEIEDAIIFLDSAIELFPDNHSLWYLKGDCMSDGMKNVDDIVACYDKAIELNSDNGEIWHSKGCRLSWRNLNKEAIVCFDKALELKKNNVFLWIHKGTCLFRLGRHEEELICYEEALKIAKTNEEISDVIFERVQALEKLERYDEAIEDYNKLLELDDVFPDFVWSSREALLFEIGRYRDSVDLKLNEADRFFQNGQYDKALFWYDVAENALRDIKEDYATDLFQDYAKLYLKRSKTKQLLGDEDGAKEDMKMHKQKAQEA